MKQWRCLNKTPSERQYRTAPVTPLQFAKAECANYTQSGGCAGVGIKDDGSLYGFGPKTKCLLALGQRCQYFEECVFPMKISPPLDAAAKVRRDSIEEAKWQYRQQTGFLAKKRSDTPKQGQNGGALPPSCPATEKVE